MSRRRTARRVLAAAAVLAAAGLAWAWLSDPVPRGRDAARPWTEDWRPVRPGLDYTGAVLTEPRPLRLHAVRADLMTPGVEVVASPPRPAAGRETTSERVSAFLRRHGCAVAINASLFEPVRRVLAGPADVVGLAVFEGRTWSPAVSNLHAVTFDRENRAALALPHAGMTNAWMGAGGLLAVLVDGRNTGENGTPEPRSLVGGSADGRFLYFVAVDGRQPGFSEGATPAEAAEFLRRLGAHWALNLDGGGSTTLALARRGWGARVVNRPADHLFGLLQRPVATSLGVRFRDRASRPPPAPPRGEIKP
ncbi:MAG TPA: phosphodiester glycosidase family protein, partial [Verrucomicrobiota bacterium]|nr:phosphodiester glycosidase family protein [Verrucomicrobiota bacterium]